MLRVYARFALFLLGLVAVVILFAFAFTAAAVVALVGLAAYALFGRKSWTVVRPEQTERERPPLIIDHDPDDLPPDRR